MIVINTSLEDRRLCNREAKDMGVLHGSFTKGAGNALGMMGEHLVLRHIGGERVSETNFKYDIVLPNGITVDVKTTKASGVPEPHYVARVYGAEAQAEKLRSKCDVYYFVRCNGQMTLATIVGWLPAKTFMDRALFLPKGNVDPNDGKLSYADEFSVPISELYSPSVKITKRLLKSA